MPLANSTPNGSGMASDKDPDEQREVLIEDLGEDLQKAHKKGIVLQTQLQQLKRESIELDDAVEKVQVQLDGVHETSEHEKQVNCGCDGCSYTQKLGELQEAQEEKRQEVLATVGKMREHARGMEEVQNRIDLIEQAPPEILDEQFAHRFPTGTYPGKYDPYTEGK